MFYQNNLGMRNTADVTSGKSVTVWYQSISCRGAINPLVAFSTFMEERTRCYCFVLSRTLHDTQFSLNKRMTFICHYYTIISRDISIITGVYDFLFTLPIWGPSLLSLIMLLEEPSGSVTGGWNMKFTLQLAREVSQLPFFIMFNLLPLIFTSEKYLWVSADSVKCYF
jgi:hypothetical protein